MNQPIPSEPATTNPLPPIVSAMQPARGVIATPADFAVQLTLMKSPPTSTT